MFNLNGDVFICHHSCSTVEDLHYDLSLLMPLMILLKKNEYPRRLVEHTIREIKNFENNGNQN